MGGGYIHITLLSLRLFPLSLTINIPLYEVMFS